MNYEVAKARIATLIDENEHSEAAVLSADLLVAVLEDKGLNAIVARSYQVVLQEIWDRHELAGEISYHEGKARDGIAGMIRKELELHGV